jgi:prophage regulatory protein
MKPIRYQRRPEVLQQAGISNSTLCKRISEGRFVPPISLGERAVGWLQHEVNQVLAAMAQGRTHSELRKLVKDLVQARMELTQQGSAA